jgi:hypothetical protein
VSNELLVDASSKYPFAPRTLGHIAIKLLRVGGGGETVSVLDGNSFVFRSSNEVCDSVRVSCLNAPISN